jgi:hypothetical protein
MKCIDERVQRCLNTYIINFMPTSQFGSLSGKKGVACSRCTPSGRRASTAPLAILKPASISACSRATSQSPPPDAAETSAAVSKWRGSLPTLEGMSRMHLQHTTCDEYHANPAESYCEFAYVMRSNLHDLHAPATNKGHPPFLRVREYIEASSGGPGKPCGTLLIQ